MDPNMMETASSPPNFGSPQSPLEMKPDPNMIAMGQGIVFTRSKMYKYDLDFLDTCHRIFEWVHRSLKSPEVNFDVIHDHRG